MLNSDHILFINYLIHYSKIYKNLFVDINYWEFSVNSQSSHCFNCVQIRSFFWSVFSHTWDEYGDLRITGKYGPESDYSHKLWLWDSWVKESKWKTTRTFLQVSIKMLKLAIGKLKLTAKESNIEGCQNMLKKETIIELTGKSTGTCTKNQDL